MEYEFVDYLVLQLCLSSASTGVNTSMRSHQICTFLSAPTIYIRWRCSAGERPRPLSLRIRSQTCPNGHSGTLPPKRQQIALLRLHFISTVTQANSRCKPVSLSDYRHEDSEDIGSPPTPVTAEAITLAPDHPDWHLLERQNREGGRPCTRRQLPWVGIRSAFSLWKHQTNTTSKASSKLSTWTTRIASSTTLCHIVGEIRARQARFFALTAT